MPQRPALTGLKVLVVEDNYLIAEQLRRLLERNGCAVVGPAAGVARGLELVGQSEDLDGALLDINLRGVLCYPIAAELGARRVPFVFLTGYGDSGIIPPDFAAVPRIGKPPDEDELLAAIEGAFARSRRHA